jgi:CPA2 family monovalent cation:H+ antiporter-2
MEDEAYDHDRPGRRPYPPGHQPQDLADVRHLCHVLADDDQSVILGYILAGIVISSSVSGVLGRRTAVAEMADIGIILLLFALGVRLSFRDLLRVGPVALLGGTVQVLTLLGLGAVAGLVLGWSPTEALFFGAVIAISSSAALGTLLQERGEEGTEHGRIALAWSAVQDLATIVLVVVLSSLAGHGTSPVIGVLGGPAGLRCS